MTDMLDSATLRRWAIRCGALADSARNAEDRARLLKMQTALNELASTQDWLDGQSRHLRPTG